MDHPAEFESNPQVEVIIANITQLMDEAEQMLRDSTSEHAEEQIELLRTHCDNMRMHLDRLCTSTGLVIAGGAQRADRAIRAHPYQSMAAALGVGLLVGLVLGRRAD